MLGAIIGGAVGLAGSLLGGSSANKAADKAAESTERAARISADLQREIYNKNNALLAPTVQTGNAAQGAINNFLGIDDGVDWASYVQADPAAMRDYLAHWSGAPGSAGTMSLADYGRFHYTNDLAFKRGEKTDLAGNRYAGADPNYQGFDLSRFQGGQAALDRFRQTTGYQDSVNEAMRGVEGLYGGMGATKSGAAIKSALGEANRLAMGSRGEYLNALGNQQAAGVAAGSALSGVGTNFANSMSNIYGQQGADAANAALLKGRNTANMYDSIANFGGSILGSVVK